MVYLVLRFAVAIVHSGVSQQGLIYLDSYSSVLNLFVLNSGTIVYFRFQKLCVVFPK
jgi:hypothetical protein